MSRYIVVLAALLASSCSSGSDAVAPTTGGVAITLTTTGDLPDPDGYFVSVDGGPSFSIGVNGSLTMDGISAGAHTVTLSSIADNCTLVGDNPRTVTVVAGDTVAVAATVNCPTPAPTTGTIEVRTRTTGGGDDENGYTVKLDNGPRQIINTIGSVTYTNVTPGVHTVDLDGLASFCTLQGSNPQTTTVDQGEAVIVTFRVTCIAPPPPTP